jgi:DnaJ-class molecular chaperone
MEQFEISDYYERLGITPAATSGEIKSAYRRMAMKCHPDANPGNPNSHKNFIAVSQAFETLYNSVRREEYDKTRFQPVACPVQGHITTRETKENEEEKFHFYEEFFKQYFHFNGEYIILRDKIKENITLNNNRIKIKEGKSLEEIIFKEDYF